jgi:prepilin-type N-terminal cleavage/methylation domain-containing protein
MLPTRLNLRRAARFLNRGGFTLVELLVVIGIIAILAGVALGPITNGIKKAKQSAGVQAGHALGLSMYSYANDNSQTYPDATGADGATVARALLGGGYVSDPGIFYISGDGNGGYKYSAITPAATTITVASVSWDFMGANGTGASSVNYTYLPLLWSTLAAGAEPTIPTAGASAITGTTSTKSPFGTDGLAIFYINNSASFVVGSLSSASASNVTMVTSSNNTGGGGAGYAPIVGQ